MLALEHILIDTSLLSVTSIFGSQTSLQYNHIEITLFSNYPTYSKPEYQHAKMVIWRKIVITRRAQTETERQCLSQLADELFLISTGTKPSPNTLKTFSRVYIDRLNNPKSVYLVTGRNEQFRILAIKSSP